MAVLFEDLMKLSTDQGQRDVKGEIATHIPQRAIFVPETMFQLQLQSSRSLRAASVQLVRTLKKTHMVSSAK